LRRTSDINKTCLFALTIHTTLSAKGPQFCKRRVKKFTQYDIQDKMEDAGVVWEENR